MPTSIQSVTISFPEVRLHPSAGHKLRGYFGNLFREHSELLHNHYETGALRYQYPLVQYKVVNQTPVLLGLGEGAELLVELFLQVRELRIEGQEYLVLQKDITSTIAALGVVPTLYKYSFHTLWMGLNQQSHTAYKQMSEEERPLLLDKILTGNMLAVMKGLGYRETERILVRSELTEQTTNFKNQKMLAFHGSFTTNMQLPALIGLGKSVSRGYGAIGPVRM